MSTFTVVLLLQVHSMWDQIGVESERDKVTRRMNTL